MVTAINGMAVIGYDNASLGLLALRPIDTFYEIGNRVHRELLVHGRSISSPGQSLSNRGRACQACGAQFL